MLAKVGDGVLKDALNSNNPGKNLNPTAFYLGNWIADLTQVVDPVAYHDLVCWLRSVLRSVPIDDLFRRFEADAPGWVKEAAELFDLANALREQLAAAKRELNVISNLIIEAIEGGRLAATVKKAVQVMGYARFVAPQQGGEPPRMHPDCYEVVFNKLYRQHFPYVHLDRSADTLTETLDEPKGPRHKHRVTAPPSQGDVYEYLRDHIQVAATGLAYLDAGKKGTPATQSWAAATFHPDRTKFRDEDGELKEIKDTEPAWNYHLAKLGFTIHAIEDFFSHSTFIDHAHRVLPASYKRFEKAEEAEILGRRLKRWRPECDKEPWQNLPQESHIVTGYFDKHDTVISLLHNLEHIIGLERTSLGQHADAVVEFEYRRFLFEALELLSDPKGTMQRSRPKKRGKSDEAENRVARWIWDKYQDMLGDDLERLKHGDEKLNEAIEARDQARRPKYRLKERPAQLRAPWQRSSTTASRSGRDMVGGGRGCATSSTRRPVTSRAARQPLAQLLRDRQADAGKGIRKVALRSAGRTLRLDRTGRSRGGKLARVRR